VNETKVVGVIAWKMADQFHADIFVGNADLPYIYDQLLPDRAEAKKLVEDKLYTCSTIMFYWGVDKEYPQIAHHNVFLGGDYKASFDQIFNDHTLPEVPSFYVHAPKRTDPAAGPEGQDTLYVLVPVGHLDARSKQDWDALVKRARETVLTRLAKELGATDLEQHIKFEMVYQPKVWKERFNLENGAAFGSVTTSGRSAICVRIIAISNTRTCTSQAHPPTPARACPSFCFLLV
jgi:phytoene dehydrogenase-like protein